MAQWNECDININTVIISFISNSTENTENTSGKSQTASYSCWHPTVLNPCVAAGLRHLCLCTVYSLVCWKMCSIHIVISRLYICVSVVDEHFCCVLWYLFNVQTCLSWLQNTCALLICSHFLSWIYIQVNLEPLSTYFTCFIHKNNFVTYISPVFPWQFT
jgi:hypothetical protein